MKLNETTYFMPSSDGTKKYKVSHIDAYFCECKDFLYRCKDSGLYCKHINAIILFNKLKNKVETEDFDFTEIADNDDDTCPNCNGKKLLKQGMRKNKSGAKQKYRCSDCKAYFVLDATKGIKGNAKMVCLVLDMYYKGNSLRDIQDTLYRNFGLRLHHETVRRWINRFMDRINSYTATLKPQTSDKLHVDEQSIRVKGQNVWCWNALDNKTRFLLANQITPVRRTKDARDILHKAKAVMSQRPKEVATDKGQFYIRAVKKEFAGHRRIDPALHLEHVRRKMDNQLIERYHATYRERDKVIRGLKSEETAEQYIENWKTFYNFVRPHQTFNGLTPSQVAGIDTGNRVNRWLELLKRSQEVKLTNATPIKN